MLTELLLLWANTHTHTGLIKSVRLISHLRSNYNCPARIWSASIKYIGREISVGSVVHLHSRVTNWHRIQLFCIEFGIVRCCLIVVHYSFVISTWCRLIMLRNIPMSKGSILIQIWHSFIFLIWNNELKFAIIKLQVLPGLYVGNYRDSKDHQQLERHRITHIVAIHDSPRRLLPVPGYHTINGCLSMDKQSE